MLLNDLLIMLLLGGGSSRLHLRLLIVLVLLTSLEGHVLLLELERVLEIKLYVFAAGAPLRLA